jgi:hypothetical protein
MSEEECELENRVRHVAKTTQPLLGDQNTVQSPDKEANSSAEPVKKSSETPLPNEPEPALPASTRPQKVVRKPLTGRAGLTCDERGRIKVRVVKACPNPRLADCLVLEGEQEGKRILVDVRRSAVFYPGVEFEAVRPRGDSKYVWEYRGPLPRWRGDPHLEGVRAAPRGRVVGQAATRGIRGIRVIG